MENFPMYWPKDGWKEDWGHNSDDAVTNYWARLLNQEYQGNYASTKLSRKSEIGVSIVKFMGANITAKSYTAPRREATRLQHAGDVLQDANAKEKQKQAARHRMNEGRRGGPPPPTSGQIEVAKIKVLRNVQLWDNYCASRDALRAALDDIDNPIEKVRWTYQGDSESGFHALPILDQSVGEVLLFHGTSPQVMKLIASGGFRPDLGANKNASNPDLAPKYGVLGQGTYFSDSFSKVMTYTGCHHCGAYQCSCRNKRDKLSKRCVMLSRVLLGIPKSNKAKGQFGSGALRTQAHNHPIEKVQNNNNEERHSIYAKGYKFGDLSFHSGSNEFLIKNAQYAYPEFVIYWRHEELA